MDKKNMLIKMASQDKTAALIANVCLADRMTKVARRVAVHGFVMDRAMNKKADFQDYLNKAWEGAKNWWSDDANKAGLATGALGALGTYGLTGLVPGLKNNTALRLALSGAGGYGGFKGGRSAWNFAKSQGNVAGQEAQAKQDAEELKNRESEWSAERTRLNEGITKAEEKGKADVAAAEERAAKERAAFGEERTRMQTAIDAAKAREKELTDAGAAENAKLLEYAKAQNQRRMQESQELVNANFEKKLTGFIQNLLKNGPLPAEIAKQQIDSLSERLNTTTDPVQKQLIENAIKAIKDNTAAPVQAPATFTFGGK